MALVFPPQPVYPYALDSDYTLFLVYNTSEAALASDNSAWAQEIEIIPVGEDDPEIWADNGFANISGELFYYDEVEKDVNDKVYKLKKCARNLGGSKTKFNSIGTMVRGFVIAEHHNQLVDTTIIIERFIGTVPCNDPDDQTIVCLLEELEAEAECIDDNNCPTVNFDLFINEQESDTCAGTLVDYVVDIAGQFTSFRIDFGDGNFSLQQAGSHTYPTNAVIDPIVTVSNNDCQIILTPTERETPTTPPQAETPPPFEIPIPVIPDFPQLEIPSNIIPEQVLTLPQIVFPCLDVGPIGSIGSIPSIISIDPPINIPSEISITAVNIPSEININSDPINIPSLINFGPVDIPSTISFAPFSADIVLGDISIDFPTEISFGPVDIPSVINFGPVNIPSVIVFGPAPSIPPITFGPTPSIEDIQFGPPPSIPDISIILGVSDIPVDWGTPPTISVETISVDFGEPPGISVDWGTPPTLSCTVSVQCPSSPSTPMAKRSFLEENFEDSFDASSNEIEIDYANIGIPSEIKMIAPEIPDVRLTHNIPEKIVVELEKIDIPSVIELDGTSIPTEINLVGDIPQSIRLDATEIPEFIQLRLDEVPSIKLEIPDFPKTLSVEGIPDKIQVEGIPSTIEIVGDIPKEIIAKLQVPKDLEVPLVYKGGPIPLKLELNSDTTETDEPCFKLVQCVPK